MQPSSCQLGNIGDLVHQPAQLLQQRQHGSARNALSSHITMTLSKKSSYNGLSVTSAFRFCPCSRRDQDSPCANGAMSCMAWYRSRSAASFSSSRFHGAPSHPHQFLRVLAHDVLHALVGRGQILRHFQARQKARTPCRRGKTSCMRPFSIWSTASICDASKSALAQIAAQAIQHEAFHIACHRRAQHARGEILRQLS